MYDFSSRKFHPLVWADQGNTFYVEDFNRKTVRTDINIFAGIFHRKCIEQIAFSS